MRNKTPYLYEIGISASSASSNERALTKVQRDYQIELRDQFPMQERSSGIAFPFFENRSLNATGSTSVAGDQGGDTIGLDVPEIGLAFRDAMALIPLGASVHGALRSNLELPRQLPGLVASWLPENAAASSSSFTFSPLVLAPSRIAAYLDVSDQLLKQGVGIEAFLRKALMAALAEAIQYVAINGTGTSNQPLGLLNTSGISTITNNTGNGSAPSYSDLQQLEYLVTGTGKSGQSGTGWVCSPKVRKNLRNTFVNGTGSIPIWSEKSPDSLLGYTAGVTTASPDNITTGVSTTSAIIFGNWSELHLGFWGPGIFVEAVRILSNPSNDPGITRFVASCYFASGVRTPTVFAVKPDCIVS
jgi:HK97 family phage major capsid protein